MKALIKAKTSLRSKKKKFKLSKHKAWLNQQIFHFAQQTCLSIHLNFVVFVLDFTVCACAARQRRSEDRNQNIISQAAIGCAHKTKSCTAHSPTKCVQVHLQEMNAFQVPLEKMNAFQVHSAGDERLPGSFRGDERLPG